MKFNIFEHDVFSIVLQYLDFDDKIKLGLIRKKNYIKNFDILDKRYAKRDMSDRLHICNECHMDLSYNIFENIQTFTITRIEENSSYRVEFNNDISLFMFATFHPVAIRSFYDICDRNNIIISPPKGQCIFELDLPDNIYTEILENVVNIYSKGVQIDGLCDVCYRCGTFGHYSDSKLCPLYSLQYENYYIKKKTKCSLDSVIGQIIYDDKREKTMDKLKKKLCINCMTLYKKKRCLYEKCGKCCNCHVHTHT